MWTAVRLVVVAAWMAGILAGCSEKTPPAPTAVPVVVATAVTKPMPVRVQAVGNILAAESVTVRSQVTGQLSAVHFTEGQDVKRGQLLFTIDPRPFETQLQQAQAELTRVLAAAEFARREAARYQELFNRGLVARSQYEQVASNAASAEAMARAARAAVDNTRLQLSYTAVRAPLDGRSGRVLVDRGNLVQANATDLLVINQLRPIEVSFAVPSDYLNEIRRRAEQNELEVTATPTTASIPRRAPSSSRPRSRTRTRGCGPGSSSPSSSRSASSRTRSWCRRRRSRQASRAPTCSSSSRTAPRTCGRWPWRGRSATRRCWPRD